MSTMQRAIYSEAGRHSLSAYSRTLANARPDPDFKYFSKAIARA